MTPRSNPFEEIERLFENMSRQFEDASWSFGDREPFARFSTGMQSMAVDVVEHDDEFVVTVDLPGFERDDIHVRVVDHRLMIEADHEESMEEGDETYLRQERSHREMHRTVTLPDAVDPDEVTARMKNGVLTLTCPKVQVEEAHEIDIE